VPELLPLGADVMFTILNATRLAVMQVGVITIGVLGAGLCRKMYTLGGRQPPLLTGLVADYGFIGLILPLAWIAVAVLIYRKEVSDTVKSMMFVSGIAFVAIMVLFFVIIDFSP